MTTQQTMIALAAAAAIVLLAALFARGRWGLVLLSAGLFTVLAALVFALPNQRLAALNASVESWSDSHRTDRRGELAGGIWTTIGTPINVLMVAVVCGTLLSLWRRSPIPVVLVMGGVGLGVAIEETLKATIYPHSFPSGHVTGTATLLGMIAVCMAAGDSRLAKTAVGLLVAESVLFVAALAVYIGAHNVTEVVGGMVLGGAILALGAAVLDAAPRRRAVRTPARAAAAGRPDSASPQRRPVPAPDDITQPLPRL